MEVEGEVNHVIDNKLQRAEFYQEKESEGIVWSSVGKSEKEIDEKIETLEKEEIENEDTGEPEEKIKSKQSDETDIRILHPADIKCKARVAEIDQKKPVSRQRILFPGKDTLDWFNPVAFADTPRGSKYVVLAVGIIVALHEKAVYSMIKNDAGVVLGQLVSREMYFIWGLVLGIGFAVWSLYGVRSGKQLIMDCFPGNEENCRNGIHAGWIIGSKQHTMDEQATFWKKWSDSPSMKALSLMSIAREEGHLDHIARLENEKGDLKREADEEAYNRVSAAYRRDDLTSLEGANLQANERYVLFGVCGLIFGLMIVAYMVITQGSA